MDTAMITLLVKLCGPVPTCFQKGVKNVYLDICNSWPQC